MPNIASLLKSEISRIARKEIRGETESLKVAVRTYRTEIAALKRRTQALEQQLRRVGKPASSPSAVAADATATHRRFSAKGLAAQRRRLGISARDCGLLVGASTQSIYNWEEGKARPRESHLVAIAALKGLGKKESKARIKALRDKE